MDRGAILREGLSVGIGVGIGAVCGGGVEVVEVIKVVRRED